MSHPIPGMRGDHVQMLGRAGHRVTLAGAFFGPTAGDDLAKLRGLHDRLEPVRLLAEASGDGFLTDVIITRSAYSRTLLTLTNTTSSASCVEYVEPPPEPTPAGPDLALSPRRCRLGSTGSRVRSTVSMCWEDSVRPVIHAGCVSTTRRRSCRRGGRSAVVGPIVSCGRPARHGGLNESRGRTAWRALLIRPRRQPRLTQWRRSCQWMAPRRQVLTSRKRSSTRKRSTSDRGDDDGLSAGERGHLDGPLPAGQPCARRGDRASRHRASAPRDPRPASVLELFSQPLQALAWAVLPFGDPLIGAAVAPWLRLLDERVAALRARRGHRRRG